jgi:hypothetical protein
MAYDAKTYGQSPFGTPKPTDGSTAEGAGKSGGQNKLPEKSSEKSSEKTSEKSADNPLGKPATKPNAPVDDGPDQGPEKAKNKTARFSAGEALPGLLNRFPNLSNPLAGRSATAASSAKAASSTSASPTSTSPASTSSANTRKSRSTPSKSTAKSKKSQATSTAKAELEAAEQAVARRFFEEDRSAYLSLLYKTGISGLVWAVLRLSRYEMSKDAIALINIVIHPTVIATVAFAFTLGLTFWARRLLNDLARHTQRLHADAEAPDGKNFRPSLEIVGDAIEYNPKLRKNFALLFDAASILVCSLVSYLVTFALFPTDG